MRDWMQQPVAAATALLTLFAVAATSSNCGDSGSTQTDGAADQGAVDHAVGQDAPRPDLGRGPDLGSDGGPQGCTRTPAAADRVRKVVVARPYGAGSAASDEFEVLELSADGVLSPTGQRFAMSNASSGEIHFTPDGEVGLVAHKDGTIGVFRFDGQGGVQVVHQGFQATAFVSRLVMAPRGDAVYALSSQWRDHGGGIYRLLVGCDGSLTEVGLVAPAQLPYAMTFVDDARALIAAKNVLGATGAEIYLVEALESQPRVLASSPAFGDDEAIVSSIALSGSGHLLIADAGMFTGKRVAVIALSTAGALGAVQLIDGLEDPAAVLISPHDNAALVLGAQADRITILNYAPSDLQQPFTVRGPLESAHKALLPAEAVMIRRGSLTGRVLTAENTAVRQIQFEQSGDVIDVAFHSSGTGTQAIVGAIGVQP